MDMTYCLGILTRFGLVMAADSRTNAGVDYVSTYQKLYDFSRPGDRVLMLCSAGNLAATQATVTLLRRDLKTEHEPNLYTLSSLYEIARYIGMKAREIQDQDRPWLERDRIDAQCTFILGGQVAGEEPGLFLIYSQGNCIQASKDTPFLQIGETKYGKPILDRILSFETTLPAATKCALLSIDSTMKSNISVGPPINLCVYETDSFQIAHELRLKRGSSYLTQIRRMWEVALRDAFDTMPDIDWDDPALLNEVEG